MLTVIWSINSNSLCYIRRLVIAAKTYIIQVAAQYVDQDLQLGFKNEIIDTVTVAKPLLMLCSLYDWLIQSYSFERGTKF